MPDLEIRRPKIIQPLACKCGQPIVGADINSFRDRVEIVCSACHASLIEFECYAPEDMEWD